jgi:hypothetical protein
MKPPRKSTLLPAQAELVELMQRLDFGNIEGLVIRDGLPVLEPRPRLVRDVKFGAGNGRRSEAGLTDFALKSSVRELMDTFASLGNATVRRLEIKHGLPFRMQVEEAAA